MSKKTTRQHKEQNEEYPKVTGISRIDQKSTHGWYCRVYKQGHRNISKLFSDTKYGGKRDAYEMAKDWVSSYRLNPDDIPGLKFLQIRTAPLANNTTTPYAGISKTVSKTGSGGTTRYPVFAVSWTEYEILVGDTVIRHAKTKKFFIHHYEHEEEALNAAVRWRQDKYHEMVQQRHEILTLIQRGQLPNYRHRDHALRMMRYHEHGAIEQ